MKTQNKQIKVKNKKFNELTLDLVGKSGGSPPGCPNGSCDSYGPRKKEKVFRFRLRGTVKRKDGSLRIRYRCCICRKEFSNSTFDLSYRFRYRGHQNIRIFWGVVHNRSNRSLSRELKISEHCIRQRIRRLSQVGLVAHRNFLNSCAGIKEDMTYDGLEAFAYSQYEPCNINQVVGADTLFTYIFNLAPMNRKGRISERQREYLRQKEIEKGRYDPKAIRWTTGAILRELVKMNRQKPFVFRSDQHFQYRRAIERDLTEDERNQITHRTVSSKDCRNYKNILFSVNHLDLLIRRKVAAFTRETICFSKKASSLLEKYILFICYKNYMKPCFTKCQKRNPDANIKSPAMQLGLVEKILTFWELFRFRNPKPKIEDLPLDWAFTMRGESAYVRSKEFLKEQEIAT